MRAINVIILFLITCLLLCVGCESSDPLYKEYDGYDYSNLSKKEIKDLYISMPETNIGDDELIQINDSEFTVLEGLCNDYVNNRYNINSANVNKKYIKLKDIFEDDAYSSFYDNTKSFVESVKIENATIIIPTATFMPGNYVINYKYNGLDCLAIYYCIKITTSANKDFFVANEEIHFGDTIIYGWLFVKENEEGCYNIIGLIEEYGD